MDSRPGIAVIAVGGNSLISDAAHESIGDQAHAAEETAHFVADIVAAGWQVVLTHGSGPQVGFILRRWELALGEVPPVPMDYAAADLQGAIGYMFQRSLHNEFRRRGMPNQAITVVTQVQVDRDDPAFVKPDKPIGSYMDEATARQRAADLGWTVMEDAGRGWRRTVPSPRPRTIVDLAPVRDLLAAGYTVIACGGGGIPVVADASGALTGQEAVIDKDHASGLLAAELGASNFVISTGVPQVAIRFNGPDQQWLAELSVTQARQYDADGEFAEGSMAPKVRAVVEFVERTGANGVITEPACIEAALRGVGGTRVVAD